MRFERLLWIVVIVALLLGGLVVGRNFDRRRITDGADVVDAAELDSFRTWLWERRALDLLVQVALVFAGTLGVAAILPNQHEEPGPGELAYEDSPEEVVVDGR